MKPDRHPPPCPCGPTRRDFVRLGLAGFLGVPLAHLLAPLAAGAAEKARSPRSLIVLWLGGGPSHIDSFDPKPGRPTGGPFAAIDTAVAGIRLSEHLPLLARQMESVSLIRSMTTREGNHGRARYYVHAGYLPGGTSHPAFGVAAAKELVPAGFELPAAVSLVGPSSGSGFLGAAFAPFQVRDPSRPVAELVPLGDVNRERFDGRLALLKLLDRSFGGRGGDAVVQAHRTFYDQAVAMMRTERARAFDLGGEPAEVRDAYGRTPFGQGCLMARRLVEAGVPYVEVTLDGWDTHLDNFGRTEKLLAALDPAFSRLVADLRERRLLERTVVLCLGEFGRTPRINPNQGRDHHARAWSLALAGGGIRGGRVIGSTDADGEAVAARPVTIPDLYATLCGALGVDPATSNLTPSGRPIRSSTAAASSPSSSRDRVLRRLLLAAAPFLAAASPLAAHDFWIEWQVAGATAAVSYHLCVGESLAGDERPLARARVVRAEWQDERGTTDLAPPAREAWLPPVLPAGARDGIIVYASQPSAITLEASRFEPYLAAEGLSEALAARQARGETDRAGRERYSRAAKALVGAAAPDLVTCPAGLRLEVVPDEDPRAQGNGGRFGVRVLWEGRALAGATVRELRRAPGETAGRPLAEERSDGDGRASFPLDGPGLYLVKVTHMVAVEGDPAAAWESVWASLTFVLGEGPAVP